MKIRRAQTNMDYGIIRDIVGDEVDSGKLLTLLNQEQCYLFIDDEENICCACLPISLTRYDIHLHRKERIEGKRLLKFMIQVKNYMFSKTDCKAMINFASVENRAIAMMMGFLGSKRICKLKGTGINSEDEIMYMYSKYKED